jgi:hypothetical protein
MARIDELRALLARVEKVEGPSRGLDRDLYLALLCDRIPEGGILVPGTDHILMPEKHGRTHSCRGVPTDGTLAPAYTASTDAAMPLVHTVFPGSWIQMDGTHGQHNWCAFLRIEGDFDAGEAWKKPTPALALCTALLSALIAQEEEARSTTTAREVSDAP